MADEITTNVASAFSPQQRMRPSAVLNWSRLSSNRLAEDIGTDDLREIQNSGFDFAKHAQLLRSDADTYGNDAAAHLLRWRAIDRRRSAELRTAGIMSENEEIQFVVNRTHDGRPLSGKIRTTSDGILEDAGPGEDVVRHSLRHTAATWLMQQGTDRWEAAGWLGMTLEQLENGYGHHHPDFQEEAFGGQRG